MGDNSNLLTYEVLYKSIKQINSVLAPEIWER